MASETAKSMPRRLRDPLFTRFVMHGAAIDIGAGPDGLSHHRYLWPALTSVRDWDLEDGDAQFMAGEPDGHYDLVHSSHCLEHLDAPVAAIARWFALVKPGGWLVVMVPDERLYEKCLWPPQFNRTHRWSYRTHGWTPMPKSVSVADLALGLGKAAQLVRVEQLISGFDFTDTSILTKPEQDDQTQLGAYPLAECGIELVVRKRRVVVGNYLELQS